MPFQPNIDDILEVGGIEYRFTGSTAQGLPESRQGKHGTVYQLQAPAGTKHALKIFTSRYRSPIHARNAPILLPYASIPGLQVCTRTVITPQRDAPLLNQVPELAYAVLMPWVDGITWQEYIQNGEPLTPAQCRIIALSLANLLRIMEQKGIAHCDLAGSNVMLPGLEWNDQAGVVKEDRASSAALVDVEHFYAPELSQPEYPPDSLAGYTPQYASQGVWGPLADRFSGAVLLAEMLGWCDSSVRMIAYPNTFFYAGEMQNNTERFRVLHEAIKNRWGNALAKTFSQVWYSRNQEDCPAFQRWYQQISEGTTVQPPQSKTFPVLENPFSQSSQTPVQNPSTDNLAKAQSLLSRGQLDEAVSLLLATYTLNPSRSAPLYAQALIHRGRKREELGDLAGALSDYRAALVVIPPGKERNHLDSQVALIRSRMGKTWQSNNLPLPAGASTGKPFTCSGQPEWIRILIIAGLLAVLLIGTVFGLSYLLTRASQKYSPPQSPDLMPSITATQLAFQGGSAATPSINPPLNPGLPQTGENSKATLQFSEKTNTPGPSLPAPAIQTSPIPMPVLPTHPPGQPYSQQLTGHIVYTCTTNAGIQRICMINSDGTGYKQLTTTTTKTGDAYPSFSPDGKNIVFVSDRSGSGYEVYTMNADGTNLVQLTHGLADASSPSYSPDGNSIVFVVNQKQIRRIWVMDKSGNGAHAITPPFGKEDYSPAWSPDGQRIVFVSITNGDRELFIMNPDGSNLVQLTRRIGDAGGKCSWSPDGSLIAFYAGQPAHHQIYTVRPDGSNLSRLTTSGNNLAPSFSPDGQWITFTGYQLPDRTDYPQIFVIHPDGSGVKQLTSGHRINWQPSWGP